MVAYVEETVDEVAFTSSGVLTKSIAASTSGSSVCSARHASAALPVSHWASRPPVALASSMAAR